MRWLAAIFLFVILTITSRAGLYDPAKPEMPFAGSKGLEALPYEIFRDRWNDLFLIGVPLPESKFRKDAMATRDALLKLPKPTPAELVRRGMLQLRLRNYDACFTDLQLAYAANRSDFWALTALGTAYQQTGQIAEAVRNLEAARDLFPDPWPGSPAERDAAKKCEAAQLKLARLRLREQIGRPGRPRPPEDVDALFDVNFNSGDYTAGKIPDAELAKLPPDAIAIVQQLLYWLPDDTRLYWQLGELYNATGDLDSTLAVFNECLDSRRMDATALRRHRQIVKEAIAARPPPPEPDPAWLPDTQKLIIAGVVIGPVLLLLIWFQFRELVRRFGGTRA